jgi:hypothetical protein
MPLDGGENFPSENFWQKIMSTEVKCSCQFCNGHIAFPPEMVGQSVACPHCGMDTKLFIPNVTKVSPSKPTQNVNVEIKRGVNPLGIASLVLGIIACVFCWIPLLGLLVIPLAGIGFVLAVVGIIMAGLSKKTGFVFPISGGIVCALSVCIALGMTVAAAKLYSDSKKTNQTTVSDETGASNQKPAASNPSAPSSSEWSQSRIVKQGDVQITLLVTHIETQRSIAQDDPRYRNLVLTNGFALELAITNTSPSKIIRGEGWSGKNNATLTDNFGNQYPQNTYRNPDPSWPSPPLLNEFSLYPNQATRDFMRFDTLVKNIKWLHLELPAENFGGTGVIRFEIPVSQISIQWPPPY